MDLILHFRVMDLGSISLEWSVAVDWVPVSASCEAITIKVAKAGGRQSALGPAAVDGGKVPFYMLWSCISVELGPDVDETLNGCDINVVDCTEVQDNGTENRPVVLCANLLTTAWARVVPGAVTDLSI